MGAFRTTAEVMVDDRDSGVSKGTAWRTTDAGAAVYCGFTPSECAPFFENAFSSTTRIASGSVSGRGPA
jgi:hypothetical protein